MFNLALDFKTQLCDLTNLVEVWNVENEKKKRAERDAEA